MQFIPQENYKNIETFTHLCIIRDFCFNLANISENEKPKLIEGYSGKVFGTQYLLPKTLLNNKTNKNFTFDFKLLSHITNELNIAGFNCKSDSYNGHYRIVFIKTQIKYDD